MFSLLFNLYVAYNRENTASNSPKTRLSRVPTVCNQANRALPTANPVMRGLSAVLITALLSLLLASPSSGIGVRGTKHPNRAPPRKTDAVPDVDEILIVSFGASFVALSRAEF
jgi:hypothetical protein